MKKGIKIFIYLKKLKNIMRNLVRMLLISLLFICCNTNVDDVPVFINSRTLLDVSHDFSQLEFNEGINDVSIEGSFSNTVWRFRLIVPQGSSDTNKRPLVVCLHGGATVIDSDFHTRTDCLEEPGLANLDAFILCPNSEGFIWYGPPEQEKVLTLTSLVKSNFHVDQGKVAIMGYSDGGNGAWFYAQHHPDAYSAAIPISSSYNPIRLEDIPVKIDIPMYVIHGQNDQLFPLEVTQEYIDISIEAGTNVEFVVAPDLEHYNSCAYVPYLMNAVIWLQTEVWN